MFQSNFILSGLKKRFSHSVSKGQPHVSTIPCPCSICNFYNKASVSFPKPNLCRPQVQVASNSIPADYNWLLIQLSNLNRPLSFKAPATIMWENGNPVCVLKLLNNNQLMKFTKEAMTKEYARNLFDKKIKSQIPEKKQIYRFKSCIVKVDCFGPSHKENYKAVIRKYDENKIHTILLTDRMFSEMFTIWNQEKLRKIISLHEFIQVSGGYPEVIRVYFPIFKNKHTSARVKKCEGILYRLIDIIESINKVKIERITMEFFTTDINIWLNNAWDILYTNIDKKENDAKLLLKSTKEFDLIKKRLTKKMSFNESSLIGPRLLKIRNWLKSMNKAVDRMKNNMEIVNLKNENHEYIKNNATMAEIILGKYKNISTPIATPLKIECKTPYEKIIKNRTTKVHSELRIRCKKTVKELLEMKNYSIRFSDQTDIGSNKYSQCKSIKTLRWSLVGSSSKIIKMGI